MMDGNGCPVDVSAEAIQEFFTEHPDTRMGVAFDDTLKNFVVRLDEEIIGKGLSVEKAVFDARKNLAIRKVLVFGRTTRGSVNEVETMAAAIKRAAILTNEKEFEKLMLDVENIRKHKPNFPEEQHGTRRGY